MATDSLQRPSPEQAPARAAIPIATTSERVPSRVLVVFAHSDDAEFTSGGSIARWTDAGVSVGYVVCTDGSKGGDTLELDDTTLREVREAEQRAAAAILGVEEVFFLRYADGGLSQVQHLKHELAGIFRRWRPERLLAWDPWRPYQLHPDHRSAGLATIEAVLAAGNPRMFRDLAAKGLAAHRVEELYLFGTDYPDVWVDVSATFERKVAAISAHCSQTRLLARWIEATRRCNADYGQACGCAYAEAFKVLRPFCEA